MKKLIMVVVLLFSALLLAGPFVAGIKTEQALEALAQQIDSNPGYSATWQRLQRGWFATEGVLQVTVEPVATSGSASAEPAGLPLLFDVNHGPLLVIDGLQPGWFSGNVRLGSEAEGWLKERLIVPAGAPLWEMRFKMELGGIVDFNDRSQGFQLNLDDVQVTVAAYEGAGTLSAGGTLEYIGQLPEMRLQGNGADLTAEQMEVMAHLDFSQKYGNVLVPGTGRFTIGALSGTGPADETLEARGLALSTSATLNDEKTLADIGLDLSLKSMVAAGETVEDAVFVGKFERVSLVFLQKYMEAMEQLEQPGGAPVAFDLLGPVMTDLLPNAPRLVIDPLAFKAPEGALDFQMFIDVDPAAAAVANPFALIQHIKVQANALVDKDLALKLLEQQARKELLARQFEAGQAIAQSDIEQTAREQARFKLDLLVVQRMLVEEQGKYKAEFSFANGRAILNGQPMPLPF